MSSQIAPIALKISNISIRQDAEGRYCLNDLHKASGNNPKHRPVNWLRTNQAIDLIAELENETAHIRAVKKTEGCHGATYARKELVYAYGMWISAAFSLKVIRAYDALQQPTPQTQDNLTINLANVAPGSSQRYLLTQQAAGALLMHPLTIDQEVVTYEQMLQQIGESPLALRRLILEYVPFDMLTLAFCAANSRMVEGMEKIQRRRVK